jgi:hypothetical protein
MERRTKVLRHSVWRASQTQTARPAARMNRWTCTSVSSVACGAAPPLPGTTLGTMMK